MSVQPIIKVRDAAYPRLRVPDLDAMEAYLVDFGLVRADRGADVLYMRGAGGSPYVHVIHKGDPAFLGFAFAASSREDLDRLAASDGFSPVTPLEGPGGGWRTGTRDPDGFDVEVVFGLQPVDALGDLTPRPLNMGDDFQRIGVPQRIKTGPSRIKRFGHLGLNVGDVATSLAWYGARFGLIASDRIMLSPGLPLAVFSRCDKGAEPADHHTILFASNMASGGVSALNHLAWEVCDIDDVHAGGEYLAAKQRAHEWGIGRHLLGSQVFDYWRDPWGHIHEHWTDGDQMDASVPAADHPISTGLTQWGPDVPATFGRTVAPDQA